jgi:hypothetical protein
VFFFGVASDHRRQDLRKLAHRHVGDEAQPPLVDAHQRQVVARQLARDAEHGAVAADHHRQVAAQSHLRRRQAFVIGDAGVQRRGRIERHLQPQPDQELGNFLQQRPDAMGLVLAHDGGVTKARRHANHYTIGPMRHAAARAMSVQ